MREFKRRRSVKQILHAPITMVLLVIVLFFLARAALRVYDIERSSSAELRSAQHNMDELNTRKEFLQNKIDKLKSDVGLEEELREKYPVVKEGEKMVIIVESSVTSTSTARDSETGFWAKVLNFFR